MKNSHTTEELVELLKKADFRIEFINSIISSGLVYMVSGNGNTISVSAWKNLMIKLEEKGYVWEGGDKPTQSKCPGELYRKLHIKNNKTMTYGQAFYAPGFNINLDDFKKLLELE